MPSSTTKDDNFSPMIRRGIFLLYPSSTIFMDVRLTPRYIIYRSHSSKNGRFHTNENSTGCEGKIAFADVTGCHIMRGRKQFGSSYDDNPVGVEASSYAAFLCIYFYPIVSTSGKLLNSAQTRRARRTLILRITEGFTWEEHFVVAQKWQSSILWLMKGGGFSLDQGNGHIPDLPPPPRHLLVFINPRSGPGKALQIFQERVVPLLAESNLHYHVVITDRANCARNYVRTTNLSQWSGIVVVSGDGLVFEVFNGLMERSDWETAIKLPVGIIPGGSGNGLARSISYATGEPYKGNMITASALHIIRGRVSPIDLVRVVTPEKTVYSFLSIGWGLMADIDIESERLRVLGEARFSVWAVIRAISLRKYRGKLSFLPVEENNLQDQSSRNNRPHMQRSNTIGCSGFDHFCNSDCHCNTNGIDEVKEECKLRCRSLSASNFNRDEEIEQLDRNLNETRFHCETATVVCSDNQNGANMNQKAAGKNVCFHDMNAAIVTSEDSPKKQQMNSILPPLEEPIVGSNWVVLEGEFVLVYVVHQTHLSSDIMFAPNAKLDDGIMWLVMIKSDVTRTQIMYFLSALHTATHMNFPFVDMIPIRAFRLEPATNEGFLTVDGESIGHGPIQAEVLPSIARVMTR